LRGVARTIVPPTRPAAATFEGFITALPRHNGTRLALLNDELFYHIRFGDFATKLSATHFPEWFGSLPASAYSLISRSLTRKSLVRMGIQVAARE